LHHIDENSSNTIFENLLPLCLTANGAMAREEFFPLPGEISPTNVQGQAENHFMQGEFQRAYGCHRILAQIYEKRLDIVNAIRALLDAIMALRPGGDAQLMRHAVLEIGRLLSHLRHRFGPLDKAEVLSRIGLLVYDHGDPNGAMEFHVQEARHYREAKEAHYGTRLHAARSAGLQHRAAAAILLAQSKRESSFALGDLDQVKAIGSSIRDSRRIGSSMAVKASSLLFIGQPQRSQILAREALDSGYKVNHWTEADLHSLLGTVYSARRHGPKAVEHLRKAWDLYKRYDIRPEPGVFQARDPGPLLREFGFLIPDIGKREPGLLSREELRTLLATILNS
jgi:tetratricopeptide (TPR) repeat protein